ncbi:hypothetical protein PCANC_00877 [Puccinia coronata f. sp. avenae]|uniref:Uncharacterized protein n=1 Tax=Puccinia coronata f. sp. avenae TaxID=200324 RepID=A0A2N5SVZ2_9BASI|nr:hypothetical protein PCANC_14653 [Puccinia coronata f. sp. avenae]PLW48101.1 hypothetical protein PCASD_03583 [Puccinia coronata f. sp. avenae]PLW58270.1 hypothetical protein PCANC_00877 [Puccinia coronata f. sp. avenae]
MAALCSQKAATLYAPHAFPSGKRNKAHHSRYCAEATLLCSKSAKKSLRYAEHAGATAIANWLPEKRVPTTLR